MGLGFGGLMVWVWEFRALGTVAYSRKGWGSDFRYLHLHKFSET